MALWCVEPCHVRVFFAATRRVPYSSFSSRFPFVLSAEEGFSSEGVVPASAPMDLFDAWSTNCSVLALLLGFNLIVWLLSVHCRVDRSGVRDTAPCSRLPLQPRAECVEFHDAHAGW